MEIKKNVSASNEATLENNYVEKDNLAIVKKIVNGALKLDVLISGLALVSLISVTFFGVFARYLFNSPFVWLEEVQMALILWTVFLGGSAAVRNKGHVAIEFIVEFLPKSIQKIIDVIIFFIVAYVMYFVAKNSLSFISQYAASGRVTNLLHIPLKYIYLSCPLGCALIVVNYFFLTLESLFGLKILISEEEV